MCVAMCDFADKKSISLNLPHTLRAHTSFYYNANLFALQNVQICLFIVNKIVEVVIGARTDCRRIQLLII